MQAWVKNAPLWISLKIITELSYFRGFRLTELTVANLPTFACKFVDWTEHFMGEAVNTFKFEHTVNQIQPNCYLAEYTAMPNPQGTGPALQWLNINPISVCHFADCEGTRQKHLQLKLHLGWIGCALSIVLYWLLIRSLNFQDEEMRTLSWFQGRFQAQNFLIPKSMLIACTVTSCKDRTGYIPSWNLQLARWGLFSDA